MNVLHVHSGNIFGGVERMLEALAPATAGRVPLSSSYALCFEGAVSEQLRAAGGSVYPLGTVRARRPDHVWRARRVLRRVLQERRWTVAVTHSAWSQAIFGPTVLESGIPLVRWMHAPQPGPRWLESWAARSRPALVICNSRYTADAAAPRFDDIPTLVQYPPAALRPVPPGTRGAVRAELGTAADTVVVAIAARLEKGKGHERLLDALLRLPVCSWEAWIIGGAQSRAEQAYLESLRSRASTMPDRIRFLGQRTDVPLLMTAADVYCQPNESPDSFGLSFVEALAAGLPIITTPLGAVPEMLDDVCAVLVQRGSTEALSEALRTLVTNSEARRAMSAAARRKADEFCDLASAVRRLAQALNRVATASPA